MKHVVLTGLRTTPLASYLTALGVLRLVAEQKDRSVRGAWTTDGFALYTELSKDDLLRFLLHEYAPTPVTNPWNADGGYGLGKRGGAAEFIQLLCTSQAERFAPYRATIHHTKSALTQFEGRVLKDFKPQLIEHLRSTLPTLALQWLDAVLVVSEDGFVGAPIFGSGGNDGSQDFSKAFLTALFDVLDADGSPSKTASPALQSLLFGGPTASLVHSSTGQYDPAATGGLNRGTGMDAASRSNPWSILLTLEGGLVLTAGTSRRLDGATGRRASFPFTVTATASGYASSAIVDESGTRSRELWLPIWSQKTTYREVQALFREGRVTVGRRSASTAADFALALGRLGSDRGLVAFERFGMHVRNGNNYYASPLGRWLVQDKPHTRLIDDRLSSWCDRLRRHVDASAPAALKTVRRRLDRAILHFAASSDDGHAAVELLAALGSAERQLRMSSWTDKLQPVPAFKNVRGWADLLASVTSPELRLAAALAAGRLRERRSGVVTKLGRTSWTRASDPGRVWTSGATEPGLRSMVQRDIIEEREVDEHQPKIVAPLADVARFLCGELRTDLFEDALDAMLVLGPCIVGRSDEHDLPSPLFALLAPVHHRRLGPAADDNGSELLHNTPTAIRRALSGHGEEALLVATRRLISAGCTVSVHPWSPTRAHTLRVAAALAFPLSGHQLQQLLATVTAPQQKEANHA